MMHKLLELQLKNNLKNLETYLAKLQLHQIRYMTLDQALWIAIRELYIPNIPPYYSIRVPSDPFNSNELKYGSCEIKLKAGSSMVMLTRGLAKLYFKNPYGPAACTQILRSLQTSDVKHLLQNATQIIIDIYKTFQLIGADIEPNSQTVRLTRKFSLAAIAAFEKTHGPIRNLVGSNMGEKDAITLIQLGNVGDDDRIIYSDNAARAILNNYLVNHKFDEACYQLVKDCYYDTGILAVQNMSVDEIEDRIQKQLCTLSAWNPRVGKTVCTKYSEDRSFKASMKIHLTIKNESDEVGIDINDICYNKKRNTLSLYGDTASLPQWVFNQLGNVCTEINSEELQISRLRYGILKVVIMSENKTKFYIKITDKLVDKNENVKEFAPWKIRIRSF